MNKLSLGKFSKGDTSSIKLPMGLKISHLIMIVVSVILLAVCIYLTIGYIQGKSEKANIEKSIHLKEMQIASIGEIPDIATLQQELERVQSELVENAPFPVQVKNVDVAYYIIQAAEDSNIACFEYAPSDGKGSVSIGSKSYTENSYQISRTSGGSTAGEKINRIISFLENLEEMPYSTLSITAIAMSAQEGGELWTFDLTISISSQS